MYQPCATLTRLSHVSLSTGGIRHTSTELFSPPKTSAANAAQSPVYGHHNHNNHDSLLRPFVNSTQTNSDAPKSSRAAQTSAEAAAPEKFLQFIAPLSRSGRNFV